MGSTPRRSRFKRSTLGCTQGGGSTALEVAVVFKIFFIESPYRSKNSPTGTTTTFSGFNFTGYFLISSSSARIAGDFGLA